MNGRLITTALALAGLAGAQSVEDTVARAQAKSASQKATSAASIADEAMKANSAQDEKIQGVDAKIDGLNEDYLATKATVDGLNKFKVGGLMQVQYMYYSDTNLAGGDHSKQGAWSIKRGRIKTTYDAGKGVSAVWQPNFDESGTFSTKDAFLEFQEPWLKAFGVRAGLQDMPFGFEIPYSSSSIETMERSRFENNGPFNGEKDLGVVLFVHPAEVPFLNAKVGWMNGQSNTNVSYQDPKDILGRVGFSVPFNDLGLDIDGGVSYYNDQKLLVNDTLRHYTDSAMKTYTGRLHQKMDAHVLGADLQAYVEIPMVGGLKILGEYYGGKVVGSKNSLKPYLGTNIASTSTGVADIRNAMGFYVTTVLNPIAIIPQLQLVYRFDYFDPNTDVSGNKVDAVNGFSSTDIAYTTNTIGVNWFVTGNLRLSLAYDIIANETTSAPSMDGYAGDAKRTVAQAATKGGLYTAKNDFSKNIDENQLTLRLQVMY